MSSEDRRCSESKELKSKSPVGRSAHSSPRHWHQSNGNHAPFWSFTVKPPLPTKIGWGAAGEIEAIGPEVKGFAIGDRVALAPAYAASRYGLYAESSLAPARLLISRFLRP
jgi:NADPH:quinone reductase-like Zn-dependent oxidoreductase